MNFIDNNTLQNLSNLSITQNNKSQNSFLIHLLHSTFWDIWGNKHMSKIFIQSTLENYLNSQNLLEKNFLDPITCFTCCKLAYQVYNDNNNFFYNLGFYGRKLFGILKNSL